MISEAYLVFKVLGDCVYCGTKTNLYMPSSGEYICSPSCMDMWIEDIASGRDIPTEAMDND